MSNVKTIGILGSGTWGVALARLLQRNGHQVTVWSKFCGGKYCCLLFGNYEY